MFATPRALSPRRQQRTFSARSFLVIWKRDNCGVQDVHTVDAAPSDISSGVRMGWSGRSTGHCDEADQPTGGRLLREAKYEL